MDIDVDKSLIKVIRTGEVVLGTNRTIELAKEGTPKMVIVASNCPENVKKILSETNVPMYEYPGTSVGLGPVCGKPFTIAAMAILDAGESDILALA